MKRLYKLLLAATMLVFVSACNTNPFLGLWEFESVSVGDQTMTPVAKWIRINIDGTQSSGNGWQKHSVGTWKLNGVTSELTILNTNGYKEKNDPFVVSFDGDKMLWKRTEEGKEVVVTLKKITQKPQLPADKLLGVWDFTNATVMGEDKTTDWDPESKRYLYVRWDQMFIERNTPDGRIDGVYRGYGHKPHIELIYWGDDNPRDEWELEFTGTKLRLKGVKDTPTYGTILSYERIDYFPQ